VDRTEFYFSRIVTLSVAVGGAFVFSALNRWFDPSPTVGLLVDLFICGLAGSAIGGDPLTYGGYQKQQLEISKVPEDIERTGTPEHSASKH
jgi:hypothetical protein